MTSDEKGVGVGDSEEVQIVYTIRSGNDLLNEYVINLDPETGRLLNRPPDTLPAWAALDHCKCSNCPLDSREHVWCPVAEQFAGVTDDWGDAFPFQEVDYRVDTRERCYSGTTSAEKILSSLLGLLMASCDCPHARFLRPLARFHLPLASSRETAFRALSACLLRLYFRTSGGIPDDPFAELIEQYHELQTVNEGLSERIRTAGSQDTSADALAQLDLLAHVIPFFARDTVESLRPLFQNTEAEGGA